MPGRPKTTLKRLDSLLERAAEYGNELYDLMPNQYYERPDSDDPTCAAWRCAGDAAIRSYQALDALRQLVAEKVARAEHRGSLTNEGRG